MPASCISIIGSTLSMRPPPSRGIRSSLDSAKVRGGSQAFVDYGDGSTQFVVPPPILNVDCLAVVNEEPQTTSMPPVLPVTVPSCAKYAEDDSVSRTPPPEFPVTTNWPPNLALESRLTITPRSAFPVIWQPSARSIPLCLGKIPLP